MSAEQRTTEPRPVLHGWKRVGRRQHEWKGTGGGYYRWHFHREMQRVLHAVRTGRSLRFCE